MAAALRGAKLLRVAAGVPSLAFTRSAFVARRRNYNQPNWFGVGLAFSTTAALWALNMFEKGMEKILHWKMDDTQIIRPGLSQYWDKLFKQHNEDVVEYERRKAAREHKCTECS